MTAPKPSLSQPRRILVALLAEEENEALVRYAALLATSLHAELILVAVAASVAVPVAPGEVWNPGVLQSQQQEIVDRLAAENLAEIASTLPPTLGQESVVTWGSEGQATVDAARDHRADLVVVPVRRREHELEHALHDHADRYVLHHSRVPVLVVPVAG
jgi:nucleotide-binding universal stress UspA family protein